jgi:uncharacterized membrane protein
MDTIRNPIEWGWTHLKQAAVAVTPAEDAEARREARRTAAMPLVRRITVADLKDALAKGFADLGAYRTDVVFLCLVYPVMGLVLGQLAFGHNMLPLLFPLASGFALIGPLAAVGLYEMSRRREQGTETSFADAFGVVRSPSFGSIVLLGLLLVAIFVLWIGAAWTIFALTIGPEPPISTGAFVHDVFLTPAGWVMGIVGVAVGFVFAVVVLTISVISFPLLLDRDIGLAKAIWTSVRAVRANPGPMAVWGMIVTGGLVIGSLPLFVGLIIVMPVLGHATWHLYRKVVAP